jgi:hypothetical protein
MMFERFVTASCIYSYCVSLTIHCTILHQTVIHPAYIRHTSGTHPAHIRHSSVIHPAYIRLTSVIHPSFIRRTSGTQSILHPRSNFTFGTILPRIIEQSCARDIPLLFTFLLLYNYDVREICLMQYVFNNTLHQTHNLSNIRIIFYIFIRIYCIYPAPNPAYIPAYFLHTSGT